jgi:hypothetical protein
VEQTRFVNHSVLGSVLSAVGLHNLGAEQVIALVRRG